MILLLIAILGSMTRLLTGDFNFNLDSSRTILKGSSYFLNCFAIASSFFNCCYFYYVAITSKVRMFFWLIALICLLNYLFINFERFFSFIVIRHIIRLFLLLLKVLWYRISSLYFVNINIYINLVSAYTIDGTRTKEFLLHIHALRCKCQSCFFRWCRD